MPKARVLLIAFLCLLLLPLEQVRSDVGEILTIEELHELSAGSSLARLRVHVVTLRKLAQKHIAASDKDAAFPAFMQPPWKREANGLHLWGVTRAGKSWFDAGHPELVGMNIDNFTDIEGRELTRLARESADGSGMKVFKLVFPHPITGRSAKGLHSCFSLRDSERILCAGGFKDAPE